MYEQTTATNCILWCFSHYYIETPAGNHSYILFTSIEKSYELLASVKQLEDITQMRVTMYIHQTQVLYSIVAMFLKDKFPRGKT